MSKFVFDTEDDFCADGISVGRGIQRLTEADKDAHIWQIACEIVDHLQAIQDRLRGRRRRMTQRGWLRLPF